MFIIFIFTRKPKFSSAFRNLVPGTSVTLIVRKEISLSRPLVKGTKTLEVR